MFIFPSRMTRLLLPPWWVAPEIMTQWWVVTVMSWLNADIYQPLALPQAHCSPTITMAQGGPGLITEDTVFPVTQIPELVPLASLTTSSPMHQNQSWTSGRKPDPISGSQNSVINCSGSHVPARCRSICILRQGSSWPYEASDGLHGV